MGTQQCNIHILETHSNITSHGYSKKIMIHIENNKSILKDTEMTSSVGKPYTIIETKSLPYLWKGTKLDYRRHKISSSRSKQNSLVEEKTMSDVKNKWTEWCEW